MTPFTHWLEVSDLENPSHPYAEYAMDMASFVLWSLSGRKYTGLRTSKEQYVCPGNDLPDGCSWLESDRFYNNIHDINGFVLRQYGVGGQAGNRIRLKRSPVVSIIDVEIGGVSIPPSAYYIRNSVELVLRENSGFSVCSAPVITYTHGVKPPFAGRLAAIELANEIVKSLDPESECALPERVVSYNRQNVSISMVDPQSFLEKGKVGLYKVDLFLTATNPRGALKKAKVFSPDRHKGISKR